MKKAKVVGVSVQVPLERVYDLLCNAFEGGSNYWYEITGQHPPTRYDVGERKYPHLSFPVNPGGSLTIRTLERDTFHGKSSWTLNLAAIERGLAVMAEKYPAHFGDFQKEDDDAITGDVFLQCCLFGEVVYG